MDRDTLKERTLLQQAERKQAYTITRQGDEIEIDRLTLELVEDFRSQHLILICWQYVIHRY